MAHFAEIDENNVVLRVIVVADEDCGGGEYPVSEPVGAEFCSNLLGGVWKQTSYNKNFRKNYACIGDKFDADRDAFIPPQPYASWALNEDTCLWEAPIPFPNDGKPYVWDEETGNWVEAVL